MPCPVPDHRRQPTLDTSDCPTRIPHPDRYVAKIKSITTGKSLTCHTSNGYQQRGSHTTLKVNRRLTWTSSAPTLHTLSLSSLHLDEAMELNESPVKGACIQYRSHSATVDGNASVIHARHQHTPWTSRMLGFPCTCTVWLCTEIPRWSGGIHHPLFQLGAPREVTCPVLEQTGVGTLSTPTSPRWRKRPITWHRQQTRCTTVVLFFIALQVLRTPTYDNRDQPGLPAHRPTT